MARRILGARLHASVWVSRKGDKNGEEKELYYHGALCEMRRVELQLWAAWVFRCIPREDR